jgi:tyrosinase
MAADGNFGFPEPPLFPRKIVLRGSGADCDGIIPACGFLSADAAMTTDPSGGAMEAGNRRAFLRLAGTGALALAAGGFGTRAALAAEPPPGGECLTYLGRHILIFADAPVKDGLMSAGVFIDGRPLVLHVHHDMVISALDQYTSKDSLREAAIDAVKLLQGAQIASPQPAYEPAKPLAVPSDGHAGCGCERHDCERRRAGGTRRSVAALTTSECSDFVAALLTFKRQGGYDWFVDVHGRAFSTQSWRAHMCYGFLPWHRAFLWLLETQLQQINPNVRLPYWDWSRQRSVGSPPFTDDLLGGDGYFGADAGLPGRPQLGEVTTGPFAANTGNWPLIVNADSRDYLRREIGQAISSPSGPDHTAYVLGLPTYDRYPYDMSVTSFRNQVEGWWQGQPAMHNRTHSWVGGSVLPTTAPNDPVFFLLHAYVDKLWADWQQAHPDAAFAPGSELDAPMEPFNSELGWVITPRQTLTMAAYA